MSVTLGQLRTKVYAQLREDNPIVVTSNPNTHFPDPTTIDGFLNEAMEYAAVFIEYPRDLVSVPVQDGVGSYPNPADNLVLRTAYFGNRDSLSNDIRPLTVISEETLKARYPGWLDQTDATKADRAQYLIQLDRKTIYIYPRPNAAAVSNSRKIYINYNYVPASMVNDSDVPDLPVPYHNLLVLYALHLAYIALQNQALSDDMYKIFMEKINRIKSAVTKETKEGLAFQWGDSDDADVNPNSAYGGVIP